MKIFLIAIAVALMSTAAGCRIIEYNGPDGKMVKITSFGLDTKIGHVETHTPQGTIIIDNVDSQARALSVAEKALDRVPKLP